MARTTLSERTQLSGEPPAPRSRTRRVVAVLVVLAALAFLLGVAIVAHGKKDALAQLRVRTGSVDVKEPALGYTSANDGRDLAGGDIVRTSGDGQAQVDYFDGSLTRLDATTRLVLSRLHKSKTNNIAVTLEGGRIWNRVADLSAGDSFDVKMTGATASVHGTTFEVDCRTPGRCYTIGVDDTVSLKSSSGQTADVGPGQCETIMSDGSLERCDAKRLGLVDEWVRENLAEDEELALAKTTPAPSPTPTPTENTSDLSPPVHHFVPKPTARRTTPKTPAKTAPPSTPAPTTDHNNDGVVTTPSPQRTFPPHK